MKSFIRNRPEAERGQFGVTRDRLHLALQICDALLYLRNLKLVHRDVKPSNIFLTDERGNRRHPSVRLGDFGVVKWGDFHANFGTGTLTVTHQKGLGTLKYMSPEQAVSPKDVTVRSDIFSLGITLFELFTSEILASTHHVFQTMFARLQRGTTLSRFHGMGIRLHGADEGIAELILDMHLRGATGRPTIDKIAGRLAWEYEQRFGLNWTDDY